MPSAPPCTTVTAMFKRASCLRAGLVLLASAFWISTAAAQAVPKTGSCPSGYRTSGSYCVPNSSNAAPAVAKTGSCPSGYRTSGDYCVGNSADAPHAVPKTGSCPSGYRTSGSYCVSNR